MIVCPLCSTMTICLLNVISQSASYKALMATKLLCICGKLYYVLVDIGIFGKCSECVLIIIMVCPLRMMRCFRGCCSRAWSAGACACKNKMDVAESNSAVLFLELVLTQPGGKVTVTVFSSSFTCCSLIPAGLHHHLSVISLFTWQSPILLALVASSLWPTRVTSRRAMAIA